VIYPNLEVLNNLDSQDKIRTFCTLVVVMIDSDGRY